MARAATPDDAERALELIAATGCYIIEAAAEIGCDYASLTKALKTDQFSARATVVRDESADACALLARQAIEAIEPDSTQATVARQRELASQHRWEAKMRSPRYSDKVQTEVSGSDGGPVQVEHDVSFAALALLGKIRGG